jgi:hypothetical protein
MADRRVRPLECDAVGGTGQRGRPPRSRATSSPELEQALWEREMRRLRVSVRVLTAVLVALLARMIVAGVTAAIAVSGGIIAGLLIASLVLTRRGEHIEPR